ncbi:GTP-binding protein [Streptomyces anthocyanicus]|uniref:GTP-binding protein n=1 Tax=Streptomyces anthocyanicus TaxID=68174 RepID=UPI00382FCFB4
MPLPTRRPGDSAVPQPARSAAPVTLKVVIAGGFGVGKTTAVGTVSEITPLSTEEYLTQASTAVDSLDGVEAKQSTTVAFDFGRLSLPDAPLPLELLLFGTPGQDRFVDLWYDLARGAIGAIVLVDTRRLASSFTAVSFFEDIGLPFVVAINSFDGAHRYPREQVRDALELPPHVPVLTGDARNRDDVAGVLLTLVDQALKQQSASPSTLQDAS